MTDQTGLVRYDQMVRAIAECERVDEAKDIRDKAKALEAYYKQARNKEAEKQACNVRLRAERRCGQLLEQMKDNGERASDGGPGRGRKRSEYATDLPPTLSDLNITKDQSSAYQALAQISDDEFESALNEGGQSTASLVRQAKQSAEEPEAQINPDALWLWGRLRDFENRELTSEPYPRRILESMTDGMRADVKRLAPLVSAWLGEL